MEMIHGTPASIAEETVTQMGSPENESSKPKKRQRMSVVCLNCKARKIKCDKKRPSCTNCVKCNVGHLCEYEPPHWVNRVTTSTGLPIVALKEAQVARAKQISAQPQPPLATPGAVMDTVGVDGINSAPDEIKRLRARLHVLEQSVGISPPTERPSPQSTHHAQDEENNDKVDFYELYNSLIIKRSGMEEHKPLSSLAHYKKDQYVMIMVGYFNLCATLYKAKYGDHKRKTGNKKTRLDASLTEFLYLLGERESPEVVEVVSKFIKERVPKNHTKNNHFPNVGEEKDPDIQDNVKRMAERLLPPKRIIRLLLDRFYKYVYPYFPFIDKTFFDDRLFNSILVSNDLDSPITVIIEEKFDFVLLANFLIILRMTYIGLPPVSALSDKEKILMSYPISTECIATALSALSIFKIMRKTKLTIVQALMYFRMYCNFAPEDGDGGELTQSQILFGSIVQSAYTIGLNRDASRHSQMNFDKEYANLWRRLWLGILETDRFFSTIAGHLPLIQNLNSYEIRFPDSLPTDTKLDAAMTDDLKRSQRILKLYYDLANMVNNLTSAPRVSDLTDLLRQMNVYVNINYSCNGMVPLASVPEDEYDAVNFNNNKRLQHTLQSMGLSLAVYHALSVHYESTQNQNIPKLKEYTTHLLRTTVSLSNILYKFLSNGFRGYIDENHKYFLLRYSENMLQRVINSFIGILTRCYHTVDLISRGIGSDELIRPIHDTINVTFRAASGMNVLMQNTLGTKYYQAFKTSLKYKFYLRSLRKDGYKCIRDTMQFLNQKFPDDPMSRLSLLQRLDLKMRPQTVLQELDTMNCFVNCSPTEIHHWMSIIQESAILNDQVLSSEQIIWEPSFKTLPMYDLRGTDVTSTTPGINMVHGMDMPFTPGMSSDIMSTDVSSIGMMNLDEALNLDGQGLNMDYTDFMKDSAGNTDWLFKL